MAAASFLLLGSVISIGAVASASPAGATVGPAPLAATGCAPSLGILILRYQACVNTGPNSTGYYMDTLAGWGQVAEAGLPDCGDPDAFHVQLTGPSVPLNTNSAASDFCAPNDSLGSGDTLQVGSTSPMWRPEGDVLGGSYCSILWLGDASAGYTNVAEACITVS